jgi:thiol:disulfide interchange protein
MLEPIAMFGRPHAWRRIALAVLAVLLIHAVASGQPNFERAAVSAAASQQRIAPGGEFAIAIVMDFQPSWHAWPAAAQLDRLPEDFRTFVLPTRFELAETPAWVSALGEAQLPETHAAPVPNLAGDGPPTIEVQTYSDRAIAYLPIRLAPDAPLGPATLTASVFYQACDETTCMPPLTATVEVSFEIVALENAGGAPADPALFANFDPTAYATLGAPAGAPDEAAQSDDADAAVDSAPRRTFFGIPIPAANGFAGIVVLALLSALGGFILNLTPCVLPVIPIKVLTISKHAGSPGKSLLLGLAMAAGVVAFWAGIGIPVAFFAGVTDPSRIFGIWWVTLGIGLVIGAMGVGIMGLFTINLPQQVYMVNPKADSLGGSFLFGVMTAVLGLPCFGFVAGALLAGAATLPPAVIMVIFGSLGVGMAAPYLVLSAKPSLVEKLPRTGPASELVKQVMGLLLLAAAAYFVGSGLIALVSEMPWLARQLHWWVVALFATLAALWLIVRTIQITKRPVPRAVFGVIGLAFAAFAVLYANDSTAKARQSYLERQAALAAAGAGEGQLVSGVWLDYSEALLQQARDEGYTVVLDFTAEWCLNCKALKAAVLNREPVKTALRDDRIVSMTVDLTSTTAPGWEKLRDLGQTGIPLLVVYGPGLEEPWQSNAYTSQQVLDALARAAGESAGVARAD